MAQQIMASCKDDATLLDKADASSRTSMGARGSAAHLDKHRGTVRAGHDEVDLATTAPRASIIALQQTQALFLQVAQGQVFGGVTRLFAGAGMKR